MCIEAWNKDGYIFEACANFGQNTSTFYMLPGLDLDKEIWLYSWGDDAMWINRMWAEEDCAAKKGCGGPGTKSSHWGINNDHGWCLSTDFDDWWPLWDGFVPAKRCCPIFRLMPDQTVECWIWADRRREGVDSVADRLVDGEEGIHTPLGDRLF